MNINELITELEDELQKATDAYTTAFANRDPNLKYYEDELVRITTELNALKMRRPV